MWVGPQPVMCLVCDCSVLASALALRARWCDSQTKVAVFDACSTTIACVRGLFPSRCLRVVHITQDQSTWLMHVRRL